MKKRFSITTIIIIMMSMVALLTACGRSVSQDNAGEPAQTDQAVQSEQADQTEQEAEMNGKPAKLLYMGHASIRITTPEDKVIYIDPFVGDGDAYAPAADLILETHSHYDHTVADKIENRSEDCQIITWKEALEGGAHQSFDLGYAKVEAVEAGNNANHSVSDCVGYVITLSDGIKVYVSGDTSTTEQMPSLAEQKIDYAFFCCDGIYNMDLEEAAACADLVKAKHSIPYHMTAADSGTFFDRDRAEAFNAENRLIIEEGEEIEL
ncbi:MAG: MBL fold metallo-hydrolase [Firmicutes bacterium]|nr:MBL fold metallo-hydrolase [Bacillota bacterium]